MLLTLLPFIVSSHSEKLGFSKVPEFEYSSILPILLIVNKLPLFNLALDTESLVIDLNFKENKLSAVFAVFAVLTILSTVNIVISLLLVSIFLNIISLIVALKVSLLLLCVTVSILVLVVEAKKVYIFVYETLSNCFVIVLLK